MMQNELINNITLNHKDPKQIHQLLTEYGVAIIPKYLDAATTQALFEEYEQILNEPESDYVQVLNYSAGRAASLIREAVPTGKFPTTQQVFSSDFMKQIKDAYWSPEANLNREVYVVNDVVGSRHVANDLHFDVKPTFKFFIYLTDTTAQNGAFDCAPGTHKRTAEIRAKYGKKISYKNRELSRDLPVKPEEVLPIEGPAGTLIIFSTDVFHRAGIVSQGQRHVMRGHCRTEAQENFGQGAGIPIFGNIAGKLKKLLVKD